MNAAAMALTRVRDRRRRRWPWKRLVYQALAVVTCLMFVCVSLLWVLEGQGLIILLPASLWALFYVIEHRRFKQELRAAERDLPLRPVRWWEWAWLVWCWGELVWILVTFP